MIIGIDLGTTNSLAGAWAGEKTVLIPNALGQFLTPSVVSLDDNNQILVGQAARDRLVSHPEHTASVFKRYMGTDRLFALGRKMYRAEELSALVLRALKDDAEAFLGERVSEAVITVPAYFNDAQRKATKIAGRMAGLTVDHLLTEPTAAALAYGFTGEGEEDTILVVDLGGGTLDVSLLHSFDGIMEVKATAGDIWLGGEDFTNLLVARFKSETSLPASSASPIVLGALQRQAELAKRALSDSESAAITINVDGKPLHWAIERGQFEQISESLMMRVRAPLERAIRDARVAPENISRIVFAGGAARMPMFRRMISRLFRQLPLVHIDPDEVVAKGAAVRAGMIARGAGLEEHVLTDVAPFTLGVEVASRTATGGYVPGMFLPIIERNSVIPLSRSHILQTVADSQDTLRVKIYQGESRFVQDNVLLGELNIDVPRSSAGQEKVDIRFTFDASGLLEVEATSLTTKISRKLLIEGNSGVLSKEDIAKRLVEMAKLKIHPRDEGVNRALVARAVRVFEENLGDTRTAVAAHMDAFLGALESQQPEEIARTGDALGKYLDRIDGAVLF